MANPVAIEKKSFSIIQKQLGKHTFSAKELPVITRVIHATADFDFADSLVFSEDAIRSGLDAIRQGCNIITDVNMVRVGIASKILKKYGGNIFCHIKDDDVIAEAQRKNITRAAVSIRKSKDIIRNGIMVIGNAPTALYETIRLINDESLSPRLVIGVPVGFVDAEESKIELMKLSSVPYISNKGKKGGTPVAVAVINALLKMTGQ